MRRHHLCAAARTEKTLRVTVVLVAEIAVQRQVALLVERICAALLSLDQSLLQSSRLINDCQ